MKTKREFTGLLDKNLQRIYVGTVVRTGTRRGEISGWSTSIVKRRHPKWKFWLEKTWSDYGLWEERDGMMDMQLDQELREVIKP